VAIAVGLDVGGHVRRAEARLDGQPGGPRRACAGLPDLVIELDVVRARQVGAVAGGGEENERHQRDERDDPDDHACILHGPNERQQTRA
jgi:hypothetical protein